MGKAQILTVDRNQRNLELLRQFLGKEGYETLGISSLEGIEQVLASGNQIAVALVDISGFDRSIWEYCEKLSDAGVQLLVISPQQVAKIREESMQHGAHGVLYKPLVVKELLSIIRSIVRDDE